MIRSKLLVGVLILGFTLTAFGQSKKESKPTKENIVTTDDSRWIIHDQMPVFPGGEEELLKFIYSNLHYPDSAKINHIQGKVILRFRITETGTIDKVEVIRALYPDCDKEAIRIVKALPKFIPGKYDDKPVSIWYTLPVIFKLPN